MIYAGVGARATPPAVLERMKAIAERKAREGWTLRSGGAMGADSAFYCGAKAYGDNYKIFTPDSVIPKWAMDIAEKHHPAWYNLNNYVKRLMGRNVLIVCGNLPTGPDDLAQEVICWTPGGQVVGGTGHTLRVAKTYNIPIRNLWSEGMK